MLNTSRSKTPSWVLGRDSLNCCLSPEPESKKGGPGDDSVLSMDRGETCSEASMCLWVQCVYLCPKGRKREARQKSTFVGHESETNGYQLFDTVQQKIIFSRDVVFNSELSNTL